MKRSVRILSILASFVLLLAGCDIEDLMVSVEFNSPSYSVKVGETLDLGKELSIENSEEKPVFSVSDDNLAKISGSGVLTALASGEVAVTAVVEGKDAVTKVQISELTAESITLDCPSSLVAGDDWKNVAATVKPDGYNLENLVWSITASSESLGLESEKVSASEYKIKVASFKEGGNVTIKVSDKNSEISKEMILEVKAAPVNAVAADRITIDSPKTLTESEDTWGVVTAQVQPADYDPANLFWEFEPSDPELGFEYEKVDDLQYKIRFKAYKENGKVTITVTDLVGSQYALREVAVAKRPADGVVSLSLSPESVNLLLGDDPIELKVICTPESYDKSLLEWSSSDEEVVTVANGVVTVVGEGEAVVKAKDSVSGKAAECKVTVKEPVTDIEVKKIVMKPVSLEMEVGGKDVQLIATCYDEAGNVVEDYAGLVWEASKDKDQNQLDIEIVKVSQQGVVTPVAEGMSVVTVSVSENRAVKATCSVNVTPKKIQVQEVVLPPTMFIYVGGTFSLNASVLPEDAYDKTLTYTSSDEAVATIDEEGNIVALAEGEIVITATASNGIKAECTVTVAKQYVDLGYTRLTMLVDEEKTLVPTLEPVGTANIPVTWESSDPEVVSVQDGNVKAIKAGEATVTATTADGVSGVCNVIVISDFTITLKVDKEPADGSPINLPQFEELVINASYTEGYMPEDAVWESSDPSLAVVTAGKGSAVVKAVYAGMMTEDEKKPVTITHRVGSKVLTKEFEIRQALPKDLVLSNIPENNTYYLGEYLDIQVKVLPEQAPQDVVFWGVGAGLFNGYNQANKVGSGILGITASGSSVSKEIVISVLAIPVENGTLTREHVAIEKGKSAVVGVNFVPADDWRYDYTIEWTSAEKSIATVKDGRIQGVGVGETTVSVKISNGQVITCEVAVIDASASSVKVGDYYYENGKTSPYPNIEGWGKALGMVFSTLSPVNEGDDKLLSDLPDCTHGLVVALEDADFGASDNTGWQENYPSDTSVSDWLIEEHNYRKLTDQELLCGYSNTLMIKAYNESHPESKVLITDKAPSIVLPQGTSGWYVPSYAELILLKQSLAQLQQNGFEIDATWNGETSNDGYYWSSTEYGYTAADAVHMAPHSSGVFNKIKSKNYKVRYIFAF